jgi:predicted dehydrogenase
VAEGFIHNTTAHLVSIADLFPDAIAKARPRLDAASRKAHKPGVDPKLLFSGPDAVASVMQSRDVDAVYIATPPIFHPEHLEAAVAGGKHVYVEKPVGVDVPGTRRVRRAGAAAAGKLSLAVGFQLRHATPYVELRKRIHAGAIGPLTCGLLYYYAGIGRRPDYPGVSADELRLRHWIFYKALSGDILVEQNIHLVDATNWFFNMHPVSATAVCGRNGRSGEGDCSSHYNVTYTYPGDVHITLTSTQFIKAGWEVEMRYYGAEGTAQANYGRPVRILGPSAWEFPGLGAEADQVKKKGISVGGAFSGALEDSDPNKQRSFIESISSGHLLNEAEAGADAAISGIMAREAAFTGRTMSWDETLKLTAKSELGLDIRRL